MAGGRLCDVFQQRTVLIAAMTLFNASTLICALAKNQVALIIGRGLQGTLFSLSSTWLRPRVIVPSY